jgi:hypothetical protein
VEIPNNIQTVMNKFASNLHIDITTTDAINGYGVSRRYKAELTVADSRCINCGRFAFDVPLPEQVMPVNRVCHHWIPELYSIGAKSGKDIDSALASLDTLASKFLSDHA